jgi:hypothetical protein
MYIFQENTELTMFKTSLFVIGTICITDHHHQLPPYLFLVLHNFHTVTILVIGNTGIHSCALRIGVVIHKYSYVDSLTVCTMYIAAKLGFANHISNNMANSLTSSSSLVG